MDAAVVSKDVRHTLPRSIRGCAFLIVQQPIDLINHFSTIAAPFVAFASSAHSM